jgi:hypothetical protein
MTFRRTPSGLQSLHLFFRADIVVFCEGGVPLNFEAALQDTTERETLDTLFWRRICEFCDPKRKYHFKSVGSKTTLREIARDIIERNVQSILVCVDKDFDEVCARKIAHDQVVYTFGYSWENDAVAFDVIDRVFFRLLGRSPATAAVLATARDRLRIFAARLIRWTEIEIALYTRGEGTLFPRDNPLAMVDLNGDFPILCENRLRTRLAALGYRRGPRITLRVADDEVLQRSWGKLISQYTFQVAQQLLRERDRHLRPNYNLFMRLVIAEFIEAMKDNPLHVTTQYYSGLKRIFA